MTDKNDIILKHHAISYLGLCVAKGLKRKANKQLLYFGFTRELVIRSLLVTLKVTINTSCIKYHINHI